MNVEGMLELLKLASEQSQWRGRPVQFIFPSSIAAYGMPDRESKDRYARVREWEWNSPTTMYGCNKLYCEMLGSYFCQNYKQLAAEQPVMVDFRGVRFPGLHLRSLVAGPATRECKRTNVPRQKKSTTSASCVPMHASLF